MIRHARAARLCKGWTWEGTGIAHPCAHTRSPVQKRRSPAMAGAVVGAQRSQYVDGAMITPAGK